MNESEPNQGSDQAPRGLKPGRGSPGRVWVLSAVCLVVVVVFFRASALPLVPPRMVLQDLHVGWFVWAWIAFLISMYAKYARVHFLVRPLAQVSLGRLVNIVAISSAVVILLPFRLGEFARPALLREKGKVSALHITSTVAVERITDGVVFGVLLLTGLWLAPPQEPLPSRIGNLPVPTRLVPQAASTLTLGFSVLFLGLGLLYVLREPIAAWLERSLGPRSARYSSLFQRLVTSMALGLEFLRHPRLSLPYLALTVVHVLAHAWALQWLAWSVGLTTVDFRQSLTLVGCLAIGFAFPNAPGFFGTIQLSLYAGLALYLSGSAILEGGAAFTALFYLGFLVSVFGAALLALLLEYGLPRRRSAPSPAHQVPGPPT